MVNLSTCRPCYMLSTFRRAYIYDGRRNLCFSNILGRKALTLQSVIKGFNESKLGATLCDQLPTRNVVSPTRTLSSNPNNKSDTNPLTLMEMAEVMWPNPRMSLSNWIKGKLISGYYDTHFNTKEFLEGAEQAVIKISSLLSEGRFDSLDGLVDAKILPEIQRNYSQLSVEQRQLLSVKADDIYYRFVYEIGMMFDDATEKRFVEVMAVFQGIHGSSQLREQPMSDLRTQMSESQTRMFVCNYRFFRDFTKGVEDDWTVNALNHFSPKELVDRFPYGK